MFNIIHINQQRCCMCFTKLRKSYVLSSILTIVAALFSLQIIIVLVKYLCSRCMHSAYSISFDSHSLILYKQRAVLLSLSFNMIESVMISNAYLILSSAILAHWAIWRSFVWLAIVLGKYILNHVIHGYINACIAHILSVIILSF